MVHPCWKECDLQVSPLIQFKQKASWLCRKTPSSKWEAFWSTEVFLWCSKESQWNEWPELKQNWSGMKGFHSMWHLSWKITPKYFLHRVLLRLNLPSLFMRKEHLRCQWYRVMIQSDRERFGSQGQGSGWLGPDQLPILLLHHLNVLKLKPTITPTEADWQNLHLPGFQWNTILNFFPELFFMSHSH